MEAGFYGWERSVTCPTLLKVMEVCQQLLRVSRQSADNSYQSSKTNLDVYLARVEFSSSVITEIRTWVLIEEQILLFI